LAHPKRPEKGERPKPPRLPGPPGRFGHIYAALDLGTNNCRLLVARADQDGFKVLDSFSRTVRLGEGLARTGELSDVAIERALDAIKVCAQKMRRRGVTRSWAIATEACRTARNGPAFIDRVTREAGVRFDIIAPMEEARLAARSVVPLLDRSHPAALVFDIGGGSTELIWLDLTQPEPGIIGWASLPLGVVTLAEAFQARANLPDVYASMVQDVRGRLQTLMAAAMEKGGVPTPSDYHLLGTSGTVTTIASIHLGLEKYDRSKVDGVWLPRPAVKAIVGALSGLSLEQRIAHPAIGPERAELVVPGMAILEAVYDLWPAERLRVADRGLREGMLIALMEGADAEAKAHRKKQQKRLRGRRRFGRTGRRT
jgi:exopolyphosphatase/guanosine-5'-triphosphate,3'-diphosphate pyrophosphatase